MRTAGEKRDILAGTGHARSHVGANCAGTGDEEFHVLWLGSVVVLRAFSAHVRSARGSRKYFTTSGQGEGRGERASPGAQIRLPRSAGWEKEIRRRCGSLFRMCRRGRRRGN